MSRLDTVDYASGARRQNKYGGRSDNAIRLFRLAIYCCLSRDGRVREHKHRGPLKCPVTDGQNQPYLVRDLFSGRPRRQTGSVTVDLNPYNPARVARTTAHPIQLEDRAVRTYKPTNQMFSYCTMGAEHTMCGAIRKKCSRVLRSVPRRTVRRPHM